MAEAAKHDHARPRTNFSEASLLHDEKRKRKSKGEGAGAALQKASFTKSVAKNVSLFG